MEMLYCFILGGLFLCGGAYVMLNGAKRVREETPPAKFETFASRIVIFFYLFVTFLPPISIYEYRIVKLQARKTFVQNTM